MSVRGELKYFWQPCRRGEDQRRNRLFQFSLNTSLLLKPAAGTSNTRGCAVSRAKADKIIRCHLGLTDAEDHNAASWHTCDYSWHSRSLSWGERTMLFLCWEVNSLSSNLCQNSHPLHFFQQWNNRGMQASPSPLGVIWLRQIFATPYEHYTEPLWR